MRDNFQTCLDHVLRHEGGYVNHPNDPGGETNFGISKRSYPNENIKGMTKKRAGEIYRRDYWNAVRGDDLPYGLDLVAFDAAVNSGVSRGAKWVQGAVGAQQDGKIGPATLLRVGKTDAREAINLACNTRLLFLMGLPTWGTFGKGWQRRVVDVNNTALGMVRAPVETVTRPDTTPYSPRPVAPAPAHGGKIAAAVIAAVVAVAAFLGLR